MESGSNPVRTISIPPRKITRKRNESWEPIYCLVENCYGKADPLYPLIVGTKGPYFCTTHGIKKYGGANPLDLEPPSKSERKRLETLSEYRQKGV